MCGINGIFAYRESAPRVDENELIRTREHMVNRGPDGAGAWVSKDRDVALGHRRLAIIDLSSSGEQPMVTADGRLTITFNGEIYNYRKLRQELEAKGYIFRSQSDTEVLLHLYADRGAEMLHVLRGMYAFGIWDARERLLFLARDPLGIKPLYYSDVGGTLRFASQVKALIAGGAIDSTPEPAGSTGFLLWGFVPEPYTLYRHVLALPAGSSLSLRSGASIALRSYFSVGETLRRGQEDARSFELKDRKVLAEALRDSVQHHLVSDVPVGVFLSAGVDSSLIAGLAAEGQRSSLRTLTLGFNEYRGLSHDEVPLAEKIAATLGTKHETQWISSEDFRSELAPILEAMDQPTTDGVNTYLVCRQAAKLGIKVALSGLGGDELFGGYPSFRQVPKLARWLRPARIAPVLGRLARIISRPFLGALTSTKYAGLFEYGGSYEGAYLLRRALYMPFELHEALDPVSAHVGLERLRTLPALANSIDGIRSAHGRVSAMELTWYMRNQLLRDADWAGMAHSVEVRVPFVDVDLLRFLAPWLTGHEPPSKSDAAAIAPMMLGKQTLQRPKTGFSVPVKEWLTPGNLREQRTRRGLRAWAHRVLPVQLRQFRALVLVGDAFGGHGGIAKFNRDFISAIAAMPECAEVVVIPRIVQGQIHGVPPTVRFLSAAAAGKVTFLYTVAKELFNGPIDFVIAGHINLTAIAASVACLRRRRAMLVIHGIDAWSPHQSATVRRSISKVHRIVCVSNLTAVRFAKWSNFPGDRIRILPNCVDLAQFQSRPSTSGLLREFGLEGRIVIMTLGRLASEERYKGFDEIIEILPRLAERIPEISYLICGDGRDRKRLFEKAKNLGVDSRVKFSGFVEESRKAEYYGLADAYVMPSRGEGFGIVFLEALASGLPVMGSLVDGSREALLDGKLGELVDPADSESVYQGVLRTISRGKGVPDALKHFSTDAFRERSTSIVREMLSERSPGISLRSAEI
jgi:asparagine synthase (glutamine-hydrolysing)